MLSGGTLEGERRREDFVKLSNNLPTLYTPGAVRTDHIWSCLATTRPLSIT